MVHSSEDPSPILLGSDLSIGIETQRVVYLPHGSDVQSVQHVRGTSDVSSVLLAPTEEVDIHIKCLLQLSSFAPNQHSHDALFSACSEVTNVLPSTKGNSQFPIEKLPKGLVN